MLHHIYSRGTEKRLFPALVFQQHTHLLGVHSMPGEAFCELQWISAWVLALTTPSFKSVSDAVFPISASQAGLSVLTRGLQHHLESSRGSSRCRSYGWNQQFKKSVILFILEQINNLSSVNLPNIRGYEFSLNSMENNQNRLYSGFVNKSLLISNPTAAIFRVWCVTLLSLIPGRCMALQWVTFVWIKPSLISSSLFTFRLQMAVLNRWNKCGH